MVQTFVVVPCLYGLNRVTRYNYYVNSISKMDHINVIWQKPAHLSTLFGRDIRVEQKDKDITKENEIRLTKPIPNPSKPEKHSSSVRHKGVAVSSDATQ